MLNQTVSYKTKSATDVNGDATLSSLATIPARVESKTIVFRTADGIERVSSHVIYTETLLPLGAQIWVPGADTGDASEAREVLQTGGSPAIRGSQVLYKAVLG